MSWLGRVVCVDVENNTDCCHIYLIDQITYAEHAAIKKCAAAIRKLGEQ